MLSRKTIQTLTFAAAAALLAFPASLTRAGDKTAAIKSETAPARNWVKEAQMTLKVRTKVLTHIKTSDALRIHIDTEGRTVTLTGEVEKESNVAQAASLARSVGGVAQVINNITYAPDKNRSDAVKAEAKDTGHEIKAESKDVGREIKADTKAAAEKSDNAIKDALLETKVKTKLLAQTGVNALKINVEARGGVVSLLGSVAGAARRDRAIRITRGTDGVTQVNDQLTVTTSDEAAK